MLIVCFPYKLIQSLYYDSNVIRLEIESGILLQLGAISSNQSQESGDSEKSFTAFHILCCTTAEILLLKLLMQL